jgi:predicted ferric reductase
MTIFNTEKPSQFLNLKKTTMGNLLYVVAVILIIAWAIGFIGYSAGGIIHILLVIAVIAILVRVIQGRRTL